MMKKILAFAAVAACLAFAGEVPDVSTMTEKDIAKLTYAQLMEMPLEDLMVLADKLGVSVDDLLNMKISVSSKKAMNTRESPGIISLVTEEEIRNSGARTLMDVLRLVPGFEFGYDMDGAIGPGMRGIWGHEGKVLLLIDGQEMNELLYSTLQFGNHYGVANIKRIEILRGPGSCVYGGFAELGVINIVTKKSDDLNGISASISAGAMANDFGRTAVNFGVGKFFTNIDFSVTGTAGMANRSDRPYIDASGYSYGPESDAAKETFGNVNANVNFKDLSLRFIYDRYATRTADYFDGEKAVYNSFEGYYGEAKYDIAARPNLTITPKANIKYQVPYNYLDERYPYDRSAMRISGNTIANYDYSERLNIVAGAEGYYDYASDRLDDPESVFGNEEKNVSYYNLSGFAQGLFKLPHTNFVAGGRIDGHNAFGTAFSPRLGITGPFEKWHYKAIFSKAFRAPGIENMNLPSPDGTEVTPERTTVFEVELGVRPTDNMFLTLNVFDITISDPIIYMYDESTDEEWYENLKKSGSAGFELEYRLRYAWGYATAGYSFSSAKLLANSGYFDKNKVANYEVPGHGTVTLGLPQHKFTLNTCYLVSSLSINPSMVLLSNRYSLDGDGDLQESGICVLLNLFVQYRDTFIKGLGVGIGAYNILDHTYDYLQPYDGGLPPHPGASREFIVKLSYDLGL